MCCPAWLLAYPDEDLGQVPYALVHTADGSALDAAGVQGFLRERIAAYKVPHTVEFVDTPLRDDAGKARRSAVRADDHGAIASASASMSWPVSAGFSRFSQRRNASRHGDSTSA